MTDNHVIPVVEIADLAQAHGITTYDVAYLELSLRLKSSLATQGKAAQQLGILYA